MKRVLVFAIVSLLLIGLPVNAQEPSFELVAKITSPAGDEIGTVSLGTVTADMVSDMGLSAGSMEGSVAIWARIQGLSPGFHGFHIHSVGTCDPSGERAFASAGAHLHAEGQTHGQHMGDLPSLLANKNGVALLVFATDGFTLEDLLDADGSAIIIHAAADNFGNIPTDRYDPDTDETTMNTGDAGGRAACGVITQSS